MILQRIKLSTFSVILATILLTGVILRVGSHQVYADTNQRLINIYVDGQSRTLMSDATTVGEVLKRANIKLSDNDRSEPSVDAQITTDNFNINIFRSQPVNIRDGGKSKVIESSYKTPRQIVEHAGYETDPADQFDQGIERNLVENSYVGLSINIRRAKLVHFNLYGALVDVRTAATTVGRLLEDRGVKLDSKDELSVPKDSKISEAMIIDISRPGKNFYTIKEPIHFTEKQIQDVNREIGYREIRVPGKNGTKVSTYEGKRTGHNQNKIPIQSLIEKKPVQQVVVVGAKVRATPQTKFTGDLSEAFARLRQCEAGGNYANKNNPLYRGAYQFGYGTWANYGGYYDPADAPPQVQDQKALITYQARGWQPWPVCGAGL